MVSRRFWVVSMALAGALLAVSACDKKSSGGTAPDGSAVPDTGDIPVGAYFSLSGEDTAFGVDSRQGIELRTDEANAAGGIKGRKIKVIFEDDKSNPQETTLKVQQLIDRSHVVALLGEVATARSLSGGLLAQKNGIPMITPSSTGLAVTKGRDFVFRVCFTDDKQGQAGADLVVTKLGKKRIAVLYAAQDPYSSGLSGTFKDAAKKLGAEIVADKGFQKGEKNFRTYLDQIMESKPDIIYAPIYYNDMVPIAQQAAEAKIPGSMFVGGDGWDADELIKGAGKEMEGAYFTNHYAPDVPWENSKKFLTAYKARFSREPTSLVAQSYDAAGLLYDAMGRATAIEPKAIRDAIAQTKGFQGATGSITIDANRNAEKAIVVVQIKDGKFHYFGTVGQNLAAACIPSSTPSSTGWRRAR